jgi:uncharacterized protein (DUF2249 family)
MNIISADTKISELIKMNPAAIDVIAAINPHFRKLQNPILRKLLASRVTIAEAARIGKCDISVFFDNLKPMGFIIEYKESERELPKAQHIEEESYSEKLDVREDLQAGKDPFNRIMKAVKDLKTTDTILLINSFEPVPLIKILRDQGYTIKINSVGANEVHTYIGRGKMVFQQEDVGIGSPGLFEEKEAHFSGRLSRIDVRSLPMPQPMIMILKQLETLKKGMALFVYHKRIPKFLLPELKERQYDLVYREVRDGVQLIIFKDEALV